jgi:hypothetical protein
MVLHGLKYTCKLCGSNGTSHSLEHTCKLRSRVCGSGVPFRCQPCEWPSRHKYTLVEEMRMIEAAVKLQAAWRGILRNRKLKQLKTLGQHEGLKKTEKPAVARDIGTGRGGGSGVGVSERLASVEHGSRGDKARSSTSNPPMKTDTRTCTSVHANSPISTHTATTTRATPQVAQSQLARIEALERENAATETLSRSHVEGSVIRHAHATRSRHTLAPHARALVFAWRCYRFLARCNPTRRSSSLNLLPFSCKVLCAVDGALEPIFAAYVTSLKLNFNDMTSWISCKRPPRDVANPNEG